MANFKIAGLQEFEHAVGKLGDLDIPRQCLKAAEPIVQSEMERRARRHRSSGAMAKSIKPTKPRRNKFGHYDVIRPVGRDKKGVRNMSKLAFVSFGTRRNQPPDPIIQDTVKKTQKEVLDVIQKTFEQEIKKAGF